MNLAFDGFQIALLIAAVSTHVERLLDNDSLRTMTRLEGVIPMTLYIGIAIAAWLATPSP